MVTPALSVFVFLVGLLMLAYDGYVEDTGSPPVHTLDVAIPVLIAAAVLMGLAVWRVHSLGLRAAIVRLGLGALGGLVAFVIGLNIVYS